MSATTLVKGFLNQLLRTVNLRIETLTKENLEAARLDGLVRAGYFGRPVFPITRPFEVKGDRSVVDALGRYRNRFDDFEDPLRNGVGYTFNNDFFSSPDAEILYTFVREFRPATVVEVGSGHSTKVIRQAIIDGGLGTRLVSVDPQPRAEIRTLADRVYYQPVETPEIKEVLCSLGKGDILFIDSSHEIKTGNDVVFLYLVVLPDLPSGVVIHIHDVFLPYEYPKEWIVEKRRGWNEQYLVQALLMFTDAFEVLWAGHFLQRTRMDFRQYFPHMNGRQAQSLWLRKKT